MRLVCTQARHTIQKKKLEKKTVGYCVSPSINDTIKRTSQGIFIMPRAAKDKIVEGDYNGESEKQLYQ